MIEIRKLSFDPRLPANPTPSVDYLTRQNIRLTELLREQSNTINRIIDEMGLVTYKEGAQLDPFGWLRTGSRTVAFEYSGQYDQGLLLWEHVLSGTGSVTFVPTTGANTLSTGGTASGAKAIRQTHEYHLYLPGRGRSAIIGMNIGAAQTNLRRRVGMFDADNGFFIEQTSTGLRFVVRSNISGSPVDSLHESADWNIDKLNGKGVSGLTLDITKAQGFVVDVVGYNAGKIRFGFLLDGQIKYAHEVNNLNSASAFSIGTTSLPIRYEIENTGITSDTYTLGASSCVVYNEDGGSNELGYEFSASMGATTLGVTTRRPVFSIRPKATYNGLTNRGHVHLMKFDIIAKTNDCYYEIIRNGTLTGASFLPVGAQVPAGSFVVGRRYTIHTIGTTNFTLIGAASNTVGLEFVATGVGAGTGTAVQTNSIVNYDISATAIVGGTKIQEGYVASGSGATSSGDPQEFLGRLILTNDFAGTTTDILTIVCTSLTATTNVSASMVWEEQR